MIYSTSITTPANTPASAPLRTELKMERGIIHKLELDFPPGNQFLHRLQILREGAHLFPTNPDGYLTTDGNVIAYSEFAEIDDQPISIWIHSWNLDDTYDHTVLVRLGVLPKSVLAPWLQSWQEQVAAGAL